MTNPLFPPCQIVSPAFGCGSAAAPEFSGTQRASLSQPADSVRFGTKEKTEGKVAGVFKNLNFKAACKGAGEGFVQYFKSKKGLRLDVIMHGALAVILGAATFFTMGLPIGAALGIGTFAIQSVGQILWRSGAGFFKNLKTPKEGAVPDADKKSSD